MMTSGWRETVTLPAVPAPAIMVCVAGAAASEGWEALSTSIELCCSDIFELFLKIKTFKTSTDSGDLKFQINKPRYFWQSWVWKTNDVLTFLAFLGDFLTVIKQTPPTALFTEKWNCKYCKIATLEFDPRFDQFDLDVCELLHKNFLNVVKVSDICEPESGKICCHQQSSDQLEETFFIGI